MRSEFTGRHVVVTGASGGLGVAVAEALLERGATLHLPLRAQEPPSGVFAGAEVATGVDVTDEAAVARFYARVPSPLWASIHLVGGFAMGAVTDMRLDTFEHMWSLNAVSCFLCCREAIRAMRGGPGGRIVNVAARPVERPVSGLVAYTAAKAAVAAMTRSLAEEVAADAVLVNAVAPSIIDTPHNRASMPGADHAAWPQPSELARAILFLASPANALTSGAVVPVYGRA